MENQFKTEKLLLTLYTYFITAFLGWQIISFMSIYFQTSERKIGLAIGQWSIIQTIYFPIAIFVIIVFVVLLYKSKGIKSKNFKLDFDNLKKHYIYLSFLIGGITINYTLNIFNKQQNFIELINFIIAILCLNNLSKVYNKSDRVAWLHPTTQGAVYISTVLLGISQILIFQLFETTSWGYYIIILLTFEVLRLFTRFKYLSNASYETRMIAHSLLGKYGIYFGVRVVAGIFMPIAYTIYSLFTDAGLLQGVGTLIIIGEFIDWLLFIFVSNTVKTESK